MILLLAAIVQGDRGRSDSSVLEISAKCPVRTGSDADETRARIVEVVEKYFGRVGYHKTSVADIASELAMSPTNVYRLASV